jgi:triosephosphate isomerase
MAPDGGWRLIRDSAVLLEPGRAERRSLSDEAGADVNRKVQSLAHGRRPLICSGERGRRQGGVEKLAGPRNEKVNAVVAPP